MAYTVRKERRAYACCEYRRLVGVGFEDSKLLETAHECAVAQQLYCIPVQAWSDRLEGGLRGLRSGHGMTSSTDVAHKPFASRGRAHRSRVTLA